MRQSQWLHQRIAAVVPDADPVHIEALFRLRHGPGSEVSMPDHQFERLVRENADRLREEGPERAESLARSLGLRDASPAQMPETQEGAYYVTVMRDGKPGRQPLLGPFHNDHARALSYVEAVRKVAYEIDPKTAFDGFGTARYPVGTSTPGILNAALGLDENAEEILDEGPPSLLPD